MIVRLTSAQHDICKILGSPLHREWLDRAERAGKAQWDVPMPPIGWRTLLELLTSEAFNVYGQRKGRAPGSIHRAIRRISQAIAHLEAHPALSGQALPGEHATIFVAWPDHDDRWSPYPTGRPPRILLPQWRTIGGVRVTEWANALDAATAYSSPEPMSDLLKPVAHVAFIDGP